MSSPSSMSKPVRLAVQNVGGIAETDVEFTPGVTILVGRNATNRTSLLQAVMAACGSTNVSIKGDAEEATVTLQVDGETYERRLTRENGTVVGRGDAYLDDAEMADLFAFLLESNEARQAVARSDDLREILMRPVDTTAIQAEISRLEEEKRRLDDRLDELADQEDDLPGLEQERTRLDDEIAETEAELEAVEAEIDDAADVEEERDEQEAVERKLEELRERRSELDGVRYDADTERESLDSLRQERSDLQEEREEMPDPAETDVQSVERELSSLREERRRLERKMDELDTVIQFNAEMLDGENAEVRRAMDGVSDDDGPVTDKLLEDGSVTCWTCGSTVETDAVERTIDLLKELRAGTADEKDEVQERIAELEAERSTLEERDQRREQLERRLERIEEELERGEDTLASLEDRRNELEAEIERLTEEVASLRDESRGELLELHERANELEYELGRLGNERESVEDEIAAIEEALDARSDLQEERETVQSALVDQRTRIERIQEEAVEAFNGHMETVLELLEYDNVDRIWIERTERDVKHGRGTRTEPAFDLHVVRNSEAGTAYEDTVAHLSESEREVVGLVFALAGYLVHEVYERCPFILLDSLEALDSDRIAGLVGYLREHAEFLVVALLPEDAAALDDSYERITEV